MAFQFITNENKKNAQIIWKFESHPTQYQSEQIRFERNVEFWRHKMGFSSTERVVTLNGEFQPIEYTEFEDIEVKEPEYIQFTELKEETNDEPIIDKPSDSVIDSEPTTQPDLSQDDEAPIDNPKRKSRKKTV